MTNKHVPDYINKADYNTNSPSYYHDLARKNKLIKLLAEKIWEYEETLDLTLEQITNRLESYIEENDLLMTERLEQWDLNLEKFPENVELLLQEWLSDGTLDHIINETIFSWKADKDYVDGELESINTNLNNKIDDIVVNVKEHGVMGDGVTDDTTRLQELVNMYKTLKFDDGVYMIDAVQSLSLPDNTHLILSKNAVLKAIPNDEGTHQVLNVQFSTDISITGGTIQGERHEHTGTTGTHGMGIYLKGATDVKITDTIIRDFWGDGIYIGTGQKRYCENVLITDVTCDNNRRQGISLISGVNVSIIRPKLINTNGTAPMAGLDIEPNGTDERLERIRIIDPYTENNEGSGIVIGLYLFSGSGKPVDIKIYNHIDNGSGNGLGFHRANNIQGTIDVYNPVYTENTGRAVRFTNYANTAPLVTIDRLVIRNCNTNAESTPIYGSAVVILRETQHTESYEIGRVIINEPTIEDTRETPLMRKAFYFRDETHDNVGGYKILNPLSIKGFSVGDRMFLTGTGHITDVNRQLVRKLVDSSSESFRYSAYNRTVTTESFTSFRDIHLPKAEPFSPPITFEISNSFRLDIYPDPTDKILTFGDIGQKISSNVKGSKITLQKVSDTEWAVLDMVGDWVSDS